MQNRGRFWVGIVLCAVAFALTVFAYRRESAASSLGAGFAPLMIGALLTLLFRFVWARRSGLPVLEPAGFMLCLGITAVIAGFLSLSARARENQETVDQVVEAIERGGETCPALETDALDGGFTAGPPPGTGIEDRIASNAESLGEPFASFSENAEVLLVRRGRAVAAGVIRLPVDLETIEEGGGDEEFATGVLEEIRLEAADQGLPVEDIELEGATVISLEVMDQTQLSGVIGCNLVILVSFDDATAEEAYAALAQAQ